MTPRRRLLASAALPWLVAACVVEEPPPPEPEPDFELETERVLLRGYGRSEAELCAGTTRWIDDYLDALAPAFDLAPGLLGEYRWYSDELWTTTTCSQYAGCTSTKGPTVFAPDIPIEHELAHLAGATRCPSVLSEGLAEYLRGVGDPLAGDVADVDIEHTLGASFEEEDWHTADYHRARNFVSFLTHEYDLNAVVDLCRATPDATDRDALDQAAREVLGASLDELLADYAEYPACPDEHDRAKLLECSREPVVELPLDSDATLVVDLASCNHPDAIGPQDGYYSLSYTIRLIEDGILTLSTFEFHPERDFSGTIFRFEQCASCGDGAVGYIREWDVDYVDFGEWYAAGLYVLDLQIPLEFESELHITFHR